jgi:hypothetical protein
LIGNQLLQPAVLLFKHSKTPHFGNIKASGLIPPGIKGVLMNPMLAGNLFRGITICLLLYPDDLLFGKSLTHIGPPMGV